MRQQRLWSINFIYISISSFSLSSGDGDGESSPTDLCSGRLLLVSWWLSWDGLQSQLTLTSISSRHLWLDFASLFTCKLQPVHQICSCVAVMSEFQVKRKQKSTPSTRELQWLFSVFAWAFTWFKTLRIGICHLPDMSMWIREWVQSHAFTNKEHTQIHTHKYTPHKGIQMDTHIHTEKQREHQHHAQLQR